MATRYFNALLKARQQAGFKLCVGIDPDLDEPRFPAGFNVIQYRRVYKALLGFGKWIVEQTGEYAGAFKLNSAFYEAEGPEGLQALEDTIAYIHKHAPEIPVILDAKRGDIGNSSKKYARATFDTLKADAITVAPYMGGLSLEPFWARKDKGIFVLCCTSNDGWDEFQGLTTVDDQHLFYLEVARNFSRKWNANGNIALVAGATNADKIHGIRSIIGDNMPLLIPGVGEQGGDLEAAVKAAVGANGEGIFLVNSSRGIIYAENPGQAARELHEQMYKLLKPQLA